MCKRQVEIYERDAEYLDKIKEKFRLSSKAAAIEMIIKKIKFMKVEGELR